MTELAIANYMRSEAVKSRFSDIVGGHNSNAYITNVLLTVANDPSGKLAQCKPESIYISALRAASLRLNVDQSTGQAYLVPFSNKGTLEATLIVGYKGLYDMAIRTGKYRYINVSRIFDGETVVEDRITGMMKIEGNRKTNTSPVIGWIGAFKMVNGFEKVIYMTIEEIHEHAKRYSKNYNNDKSLWKSDPVSMERKTVLRLLLRRYGYLDPSDASLVDQIDEENNGKEVEIVDVPAYDADSVTVSEVSNKSQNDLVKELGFEVSPAPQKPAQTNGNTRPYSPEVLRTRITESVKDFTNKKAVPAAATRNMIAVNLEVCFAGDPDAGKIRHTVMQYLVGKSSTKDLTDAEVLALNKWLNVTKDSGGAYTPDPLAVREANSVWRECLLEAGQQELNFESTATHSCG